MPVNWFASFRNVPWDKVLSGLPAVLEGAKSLWQRVAGDRESSSAANATPTATAPGTELLAALDVRVGPLERRAAKLEEEARASFEVVRSMAEQHSQLVHAVDVLLVRTRVLLRLCALLGVAVIALLVLVLAR
ncbi:MAG: hypothetical protein AB1452_02800 [Pseudomonadota bacterium]